MKNSKLFLALVLIVVLVFSFTFYPAVSYADDEEQTTEDTTTEDPADEDLQAEDVENNNLKAPDSLGGYTGLVAHWKFDGDLKDSTQFQNNGSNIGNITFSEAVFGKGAKFDGKSYIEVNDSDSLDLSKAFTFSLWVYKDDARDAVPFITKMHDKDSEYPYMMREWWHLTPGVYFYDGETEHEVNSEAKVDIQKWTLVTITYDGKTVKIYHDKELKKSNIEDAGLIRSSQPLYIGFGNFMTTDNFYRGVMDDLRIYNKALSYEEVESLYDNGIKTGSGKDLVIKPKKMVAFYRFEGDLKDLSQFKNDGKAINANGGIKFTDGVASKAAKFNGSSYIEVNDNDSLDFDNGFTVGAWVYKEIKKPETNHPIIEKYGNSLEDKNIAAYSLYDSTDSTGQRLGLYSFTDSNGGNFDEFDTSIEAQNGRWYYYTAAYDGSNVKLYYNGVLKQTAQYEGDIVNSNGPLWIGGTNESIFFKGIMDELRIYNYGLSDQQVKDLYNMRDRLSVAPADGKTVLSALKAKQSVKLKVDSLTYIFTPPTQATPSGKDEFKSLDVTGKSIYKSNNTKVVTVSNDGTVKAVGKGKASITVTYGKLTQNVNIIVK